MTYSYYFIFDRIVDLFLCLFTNEGTCDAYHKEFESHKRLILNISANFLEKKKDCSQSRG